MGNKSGAISVNEAGRLGGLSTFRKYGRNHYRTIGQLGQQAMRNRYPGMASLWGKSGGRPKKLSFDIIMGEQGE